MTSRATSKNPEPAISAANATTKAAKLALRTQQIVGYESGVTDTVDPLAGSYYVEWLTDEVERLATEYLERIDEMGGAVAAIEQGFLQDEIEQAAYEYAKALDSGEKVLIGVNKFVDEEFDEPDVFPIDLALQQAQVERVQALRARRDNPAVDAALADIAAAAKGTQNLLVPMRAALKAQATLGEVSDVLREEFGVYQPTR